MGEPGGYTAFIPAPGAYRRYARRGFRPYGPLIAATGTVWFSLLVYVHNLPAQTIKARKDEPIGAAPAKRLDWPGQGVSGMAARAADPQGRL